METPDEYWTRSEANRLRVSKQHLAPQTAAERARGAASQPMAFQQFLGLVKDYMRTHPGLSHNDAADAVRLNNAEGADLYERAGLNKRTAEPRPVSGALTKRAEAAQRLERLAKQRGVDIATLIADAHRDPAKHADVIDALRAYSAPDAGKNAEELAAAAREGAAVLKRQARRMAAGEPVDFGAAVELVKQRDNVPYPVAAERAATEFGDLYREYREG